MQMIPQGEGFAPPPGGSLHSLATEKLEFRVIALERVFVDFYMIFKVFYKQNELLFCLRRAWELTDTQCQIPGPDQGVGLKSTTGRDQGLIWKDEFS